MSERDNTARVAYSPIVTSAVIAERLLSKISVTPAGCFEWTGTINNYGYGVVKFKPHLMRGAHRLSYETFRRPIPEGMMVCHRCDNRCCINPAHLFLGTGGDNSADCAQKDRTRSKLSHADVAEIRRLWTDGATSRQIADQFKINHAAAYRIATGKRRWYADAAPAAMKGPARGSQNHKSLVTEEQVSEMRQLRQGGAKLSELSVRYGIAVCQVSAICLRRQWKHVP